MAAEMKGHSPSPRAPSGRTSAASFRLALSLIIFSLLIAQAAPQQKRQPAKSPKGIKNSIERFELKPGNKLFLENEHGTIKIEGWDRPECEINIFKTARPVDAERIKIDIERQADRARIRSIPLGKLQGEVSIDYIISAPLGISLVLELSSGSLSVKDFAGSLEARVGRGDIEIRNVDGPIDCRSEAGDITVVLENPPQHDLSLKTEQGNIKLSLAADKLNALIWAEAWDGIISHNLPLEAAEGSGGRTLRGQLGDGGRLIRLESRSGTISLSDVSDAALLRPKEPAVEPAPKSDSAQGSASKPDNRSEPAPRIGDVVVANPPQPERVSRPVIKKESGEPVTIRIDSNLVSLNASVRDRSSGRAITDLRKEDFEVYEDNVEQEIAHFSSVETPFNLLLLLDISGSVEEKFDIIQEASIRFTQMLKPQDRIAVAVFNSDLRLIADFTNDRRQLARAILGVRPGGGTAFYDAMYYSLTEIFQGISGRKAMVVFTDGVDNQHIPEQRQHGSIVTFPELFHTIEETEVTIYPIFLNTEGDPKSGVVVRGPLDLGSIWDDIFGRRRGRTGRRLPQPSGGAPRSELYAQAVEQLNRIAEQTGGRMYNPNEAADLEGVYQQIVDELSIQYSLGYYPTNPVKNGEWRRIKVSVKGRPNYVVRTRKGYYARASSQLADSEERRGRRRSF